MRDYDPTTGRYMQADPLGLVDGASVYGYAGQSPQVNADPTGLCWNIHSNACKAVNKARFNATLARMGQGANAYAAGNAGYGVGMAVADGCITADEVGALAFALATDLVFRWGKRLDFGPTVRNTSGTDVRKMSKVREIQRGERVADIREQVSQRTYEYDLEHAVVSMKDGRRLIVSGGKHGIILSSDVKRLIGHSHPWSLPPSGPSRFDREALRYFGQRSSYLLERGEVTRFGR